MQAADVMRVLVKQMGGAQTPALGFAMGMERLLLIMQAQGIQLPEPPVCELYIAPLGKQAQIKALPLQICCIKLL